MQRRVRVRAAQRLHQRRQRVIVLVAVAVIAHRAALGDGFRIVEAYEHLVAVRSGCRKQQLDRVERLAHIAAAGPAYPLHDARLKLRRFTLALGEDGKRAHNGRLGLLRRNGLELEHRRAAEDSAEHAEIGVFRRRGDERDAPVLDKLQQRLLLLFVEILDLVKIQQHSAGSQQRVKLGDDLFYVGKPGGRCVQLAQGAVGFFRDDARNGGLARARGAVEDHVRDAAAFDDAAQQAALAEDVLLADNIVKAVGAYFVCKGFVHVLYLRKNRPHRKCDSAADRDVVK